MGLFLFIKKNQKKKKRVFRYSGVKYEGGRYRKLRSSKRGDYLEIESF
jgi:hypothetical protein